MTAWMTLPHGSNSASSLLLLARCGLGLWQWVPQPSVILMSDDPKNNPNIYQYSWAGFDFLFITAPTGPLIWRVQIQILSICLLRLIFSGEVHWDVFDCHQVLLPQQGFVKVREVAVNSTQLLDIRRCEQLVPFWPGGAGADLKTRTVEVFNYNPYCGFRQRWPHFTIKTSS